MSRMWGDLWQFPFFAQTWEAVWTGVAAIGTVGSLWFTLILFRRDQWRTRSAEARQVLVWIQSPGASTDDGVHTYHSTFHLLNSSPRPIHNVEIRIVLPALRTYDRRRKAMHHTDAPAYTRQQWGAPVEPLKAMIEFYWDGSFHEQGVLLETVVSGDTRTKDIATPVPLRSVDVIVEFLDGDGQRWQKNVSTGKLQQIDR